MFSLKSILQAGFGFVSPVVLGVVVAPYLFSTGISKNVANKSARVETKSAVVSSEKERKLDMQSGVQNFYAKIDSDQLLNPIEDRYFVLSTVVRFDHLPEVGKHENLIAKYESTTFPYHGFALGIHHYETSLRPAVYWKDESGKGGWFTFNAVNFQKKNYYAITIIAKQGDFIQLYVEELNSLREKEVFSGKEEISLDKESNNKSIFRGAYKISQIASPANDESLNFGTFKNEFSAFVSSLIIAQPKQLNLSNLENLVSGGPDNIAKTLSKDINLWVKDGVDLSSYKRELIFPEGNA